MQYIHPNEEDKKKANDVFEDLCICWTIYKTEGYEIVNAVERLNASKEDSEKIQAIQNLLKAAIEFGIFSERVRNEKQ